MMKYIWLLIFASHFTFVLVLQDNYDFKRQIWEIKENSSYEIVIEKITDDSENIEFDPANAYVVQEQELGTLVNEFHIYYLISGETNMSIKHRTVEYVIELRNKAFAHEKRNNMNNQISVRRETYNQESSIFKSKFRSIRKNRESISPQRLYRVSKVNGEIRFQQVPVHFSELNKSDSYVFDSGKLVILFNVASENRDDQLQTAANNIGTFIYHENDYDEFNSDDKFLNCFNWIPGNNDCYSEFISKLEACPNEDFFQQIWENEEKEIPDVPEYKLYKLSKKKMKNIQPEFILDDTKTLNSLTAKNIRACCIFILDEVNEVLIYIRDFTNQEQVEKCLKFGEKFSAYDNYLVSVVEKPRLITPFIVIFKEIMSLFSYEEISFLNFSRIKITINDMLL